jgi:hypothetical protein
MKLTSLLAVFDGLPAYAELKASLSAGKKPEPLGLLSSARPALLSKLFVDQTRTILFVAGRVESVPMWQQLLDAWLPEGSRILRFPEPTPLPFERAME